MTSITAPPRELPFELGKPQSFQGLGLIPLFGRDEPTLEYIGLDEAAAARPRRHRDRRGRIRRDLAVSQPVEGQRPPLRGRRARRRQAEPRARADDPRPRAVEDAVPVNCVERGRWSYRSEQFAPAPRAAHPQMRRKSREAGQASVWAEISAKSARLDAASRRPTLSRLSSSSTARRSTSTSRRCRGGGPVRGDRRRRRPRRLPRLRVALRGLRRALRKAPPRLRPRRRRAAGRRARSRGLRAAAGRGGSHAPSAGWEPSTASASTVDSRGAASPAPSSSSATRSSPSASSRQVGRKILGCCR